MITFAIWDCHEAGRFVLGQIFNREGFMAERFTRAQNWEELELEAEKEVLAVDATGAQINMYGLYPCSDELANRGIWAEEQAVKED